MPLPTKDQEKIYRMFNEEHMGLMEIVDKTGHAFETVAKYSQKKGEMKLGPQKFKILRPYFDKIDEKLKVKPGISIKKELLPYLQREGYPGKLTALKDYCRMRKPMLKEEANPSLITHIEEEASKADTPAPTPKRKSPIIHVLDEKYRNKIEKDMREEHPWIPENEMLSRIRRLGYTGKVTMMGNFMRSIRYPICKDLHDRGLLAKKINSLANREPGMVNVLDRVLTKIVKDLVKDQILNPMDIVIPESQKDSRLSKWLTEPKKPVEVAAKAAVKAARVMPTYKGQPRKYKEKGYTRVRAYKVLEDGALFETEDQAINHMEDLIRDKTIDAFTATLPAMMSKEEVNRAIKQFAREGL